MKQYIVIFSLNGEDVFSSSVQAKSEEDAIEETEFKPFFHGLRYDDIRVHEAWM